jgi:hypothetical protein
MGAPRKLTLRQMLEAMALTLDASTAGELSATIQFDVRGSEPGSYHLRISDGACSFNTGSAEAPTLTITTPSEVWMRIGGGELSSQEALDKGLYSATGDLTLLSRLDDLFGGEGGLGYAASSGQRTPGPIRLPGMAWLAIALLPWIIFWSVFDDRGVSPWLSVGLPLVLSMLLVAYRVLYYQSTWLEVGGLGFFVLAAILSLIAGSGWRLSGSIVATTFAGMLWFGTLALSEMPLSGAYFRWGYARAFWSTGTFVYPHAVITLVWGWQLIFAALVGVVGALFPSLHTALMSARFLLLALTFAFTLGYERRARGLEAADFDEAMGRLRRWARIGMSVGSDIVLVVTIFSDDVVLIACLVAAVLVAAVGFVRFKGRRSAKG